MHEQMQVVAMLGVQAIKSSSGHVTSICHAAGSCQFSKTAEVDMPNSKQKACLLQASLLYVKRPWAQRLAMRILPLQLQQHLQTRLPMTIHPYLQGSRMSQEGRFWLAFSSFAACGRFELM